MSSLEKLAPGVVSRHLRAEMRWSCQTTGWAGVLAGIGGEEGRGGVQCRLW